MNDTTIIYYTDNSLESELAKRVQQELVKASEGKEIISVSQKPIDFGTNVCVGDIGLSHLSMFKQLLEGAKKVKTKYIALAEHDCMYTPEHFDWIPKDDSIFWYNVNHWFVQWGGDKAGQYSYWRRKPMSQLIAEKNLFIEAIKEKIELLTMGYDIKKGKPGACEPGVCDQRESVIIAKAELAKQKDLGKLPRYTAKGFRTELPNLDIRHGDNFSGGRKGRQRCYSIPYWGSFHKVMGKVPFGKWYQEATINGIKMPFRRNKDTNEKRWEKLIEPLLPFKKGKGRTFIDLGCNAGFYCRKVSDLGFKPIGVEKEPMFIRHAHYWESCEPKGVKIIENDLMDYEIPTASIVLLANVHYWLTTEKLEQLIKKLLNKALYVLIIGRYKTLNIHKSPCDKEALVKNFIGWKEINTISSGKHYSVLFKNPNLVEKDTNELLHYQQLFKSKKFLPSYAKLVHEVDSNNRPEASGHPFYDYLKWRGWSDSKQLFKRYSDLIESVKENGIEEPITIGRMEEKGFNENRLKDGDHRYIIAKELGIKKLICRKKMVA